MTNLTGVGYPNTYYPPRSQGGNNNILPGGKGNQIYSPSRLNTDAVYTMWQNPNSAPLSGNDVPITLVHLNDNHRKVKGLAKFKTAINEITQKVQKAGSDLLKVHSGDYNVGTDPQKLKLQIELLNELGVQYAAIGNHELDINPQRLANELVNAKFVSLAANLKMPAGCGLDKLAQSGKIVNSTIYETNGHRYGLIGLSPTDLIARGDSSVNMHGVDALNTEETIKVVQAEVNKLKAQGINRIILVSHIGLDLDKDIAQKTDGIDIILGGHSHDLLDPLEPGVSLFNSAANEPVLIFQNGKNAQFIGVTDAYFDDKGIVKGAIARQENAGSFEVSQQAANLEDRILGKSPVIGVASETYRDSGVKMSENAIANFIADAVRAKTGAEIALFQSFAVRDNIEKGNITDRDIDEVLPFIDAVHLTQITGQDILDALNQGAQSFVRKNKRPGILQVSGLKYTITPDGKAIDVQVQQKDGQLVPLDLNKEYNVAYDQYLVKGEEGFTSLAKPFHVVKAWYDTNADVLKQAISQRSMQPIVMKKEGRVNVLAADPGKAGKMPKALQKAPAGSVQNVQQVQYQQQQQQPIQYQQPARQLPQLNPRVAYRMPPMYPVMPPQYYYATPPTPPLPVVPRGYYYYASPEAMNASPTSFVR